MSATPDIESMTDEEELHKLLSKTEDFDLRKKIRARLKSIREEESGDEVKKKAEENAKEVMSKNKDARDAAGEETTTSTTTTDKGEDGNKRTTTTSKTKKITKAKTDNDNKNNLNQDSKVSIQRSPSAIKELMLNWCRQCTAGYEHVDIKNFSTSWNDGMAFCALIHHFYPTAFDYSKLQPKYRKGNFKLGFTVSEKLGGVAPLLDIEDMVRMKNPDWKCVFTYIQQFYRKFRNWDEEQEELRQKKEQENADKKENEIEDTSSGDKETKNES